MNDDSSEEYYSAVGTSVDIATVSTKPIQQQIFDMKTAVHDDEEEYGTEYDEDSDTFSFQSDGEEETQPVNRTGGKTSLNVSITESELLQYGNDLLKKAPVDIHDGSLFEEDEHVPTDSVLFLNAPLDFTDIDNHLGLHLNDEQEQHVKIVQITWNMQGKVPPDTSLLETFVTKNSFHIYCFTSQECERSIEKSVLNSSKQKWESVLTEFMQPDYVLLESCTLLALHSIVFIHHKLLPYISTIRKGYVACGMELFNSNIGNKGATYISFNIGNTSVLLIGCHLPAHQNNVAGRNGSFHKIVNDLNIELSKGTFHSTTVTVQALSPSNLLRNNEYSTILEQQQQQQTIYTHFDYIIWCGDMNYRINGNRAIVDKLLKLNMQDVLLSNDQLTVERKNRNVFNSFLEGAITFPPTYKFDHNSSLYDTSNKKRIPAWTDRILYYQKKAKNRRLQLLNYDAEMAVKMSDHRPVVAKFLGQVNLLNTMKKSIMYDERVLVLLKEYDEKKKLTGGTNNTITPNSQQQSSICILQ
jgi:hypothetical protein